MSRLTCDPLHFVLPFALGTFQLACHGVKESTEGSGDCIAGLNVCGDTGDTGDTGGTGGTGGTEYLGEGECVYNYDEELVGHLHKCEGTVDYQIEFDIDSLLFNPDTTNCANMQALIPDNQLCTESHDFGTESDEQPKVVACCGEHDSGSTTPYLDACTKDLAQQTCRMLLNRLEYHKNANHFTGFENQAQNVINTLASNIGNCTADLINNDMDSTPGHLDSHYTLPNNSQDYPVFKDFTIYVDIGDIDDFAAIGTVCHGMDASDDNVFKKPQASIGGTTYDVLLSSPMVATLDGPSIYGSPVAGSGTMTTINTCNSPWCSNATFEIDANDFAIQEFNLFASSAVTLSNRSGSYNLADVRIMLADAALGYLSGNDYIINAGDAFFWLVGTDPYDPTTTQYANAVNSTSIEATYDSITGVWSIDTFGIEYTDYNSDVWTITIPSSSWY